jgi:hypothetical protein
MNHNIVMGGSTAMDAKIVTNTPLPMTNNFTIGSFTTGNFDPPQGEVMKLTIPNLAGTQTEQQAGEPAFGKHIREAIAIVKDWKQKP